MRPNVLRSRPRIATNSSASMSKRRGADLPLLDGGQASFCHVPHVPIGQIEGTLIGSREPGTGSRVTSTAPFVAGTAAASAENASERQDCIGDWAKKAQGIHLPAHEFPVVRRWGTGSRVQGHCVAVVWRTPRCWARKARRGKTVMASRAASRAFFGAEFRTAL
jgi:hypothetical protein